MLSNFRKKIRAVFLLNWLFIIAICSDAMNLGDLLLPIAQNNSIDPTSFPIESYKCTKANIEYVADISKTKISSYYDEDSPSVESIEFTSLFTNVNVTLEKQLPLNYHIYNPDLFIKNRTLLI